jgi:pimeloyl-ACP methyl ester carboxylesterase
MIKVKLPSSDDNRRGRAMSIVPEIRNDSGNRTIVFLGGGSAGGEGIVIEPPASHKDYQKFLTEVEGNNWGIVALSGKGFTYDYSDKISGYAKEYSTKDNKKCTLMGHSAGGMAGLFYARDRPSDKFFERIILFNVPLIYPSDDVSAELLRAYVITQQIKVNVSVIMSKNDDRLGAPTFKLKDGTTIWDAIST